LSLWGENLVIGFHVKNCIFVRMTDKIVPATAFPLGDATAPPQVEVLKPTLIAKDRSGPSLLTVM